MDEVIDFPEWNDIEEKKPIEGEICIGLNDSQVCFFVHYEDPLNRMCGLFFVPRTAENSYGIRYCPDKIKYWLPLPNPPKSEHQ